MDDVVVKTKNLDTLIEDLKQTFENLKRWRWKLNPNKCVFGVPSGQLLGFLVKRPDFREGKSTESKCIMTVVDHITQILVENHIHTMIISEYIRFGIT